jgi:predicted enzyme related to lactoylglutathione lyase
MLKRIDTVLCQVTDMDRAVAFYRDVLKLHAGVVSPYWSDFQLGDAKIGLHPPFSDGATRPGTGWILGFEVEDLAEFKRVLAEAGASIGGIHDVPGGAVLEFFDPDGNPLQAIQHGVTMALVESR